jgi:hypothetical protein
MNNQPILEVDIFGNKCWELNGIFHREDGPAVESTDGYKEWWVNGQLHREDGPAIIGVRGYKAWYIKGKRHRVDGPAVIYRDGSKCWLLKGRQYIFEEWFKRLTPEQQYNYLWKLDE